MEETEQPVYRPFTLHMDYFATGEGRTQWVLLVRASSYDAAVATFKRVFFKEYSDSVWNYFKVGLTVKEGVDTEILSQYFSEKFIAQAAHHLPYSEPIALKWHFNYS